MAKTLAQKLSVLVADDERPARFRLVDLLHRFDFVGEIREAVNGVDAVTLIEECSPDLVLLDVQMPELDGFGVIANVGAENMPATIFVTAYDQYAIHAFEVHALDYLLKPFSDERFEQALERAHARIGSRSSRETGDGLDALFAADDAGRRRYLDRLVVKCSDCVRLLRSSEIDWIEAQGVYVSVHVGRSSLLHRASLCELAERLNPLEFTRIHRSTIVAIERVRRLEPHTHGEYIAVLADGTRLRVSRTYRAALEARLGQSL
jgi:two-component system LytT family response regulator